uniref:Ig-like domain-containing protein n=1 Tax=Monodelphis domestica TaxID=13616 RepID=A0A5F8HB65_MONDO
PPCSCLSGGSQTLGTTVSLSCTLSSGSSGRDVYWHQQSPGKAPRYLLYVTSSGSTGRGDGIPERFSGSGSGTNRFLSISNVEPEDEADYYCQSYHYPGGSYASTQ